MKKLPLTIIFLLIWAASVSCRPDKDYDALGMALTEINQKVAAHYYEGGIPDNFDVTKYKEAVADVCKNNPPCQGKAQTIFDDYDVKARKIDNMFTVMLCDRNTGKKIMEAFSCNNMKVAVPTYKKGSIETCEFEKNRQNITKENCP
jgi:hypothetical protein